MICPIVEIVTKSYQLCHENYKDDFLLVIMLFLWNAMKHTLFKDEEYVTNLIKFIDDDRYRNVNELKKFYLSSHRVHLSYFFYNPNKVKDITYNKLLDWLVKRENEALYPLK